MGLASVGTYTVQMATHYVSQATWFRFFTPLRVELDHFVRGRKTPRPRKEDDRTT